MSKSKYQENLIKTVMDKSWGNTWEEAVQEWDIIDCAEDNSLSRSCIVERNRLSIYTDYIIEKQTNGCFRLEVHVLKNFNAKIYRKKQQLQKQCLNYYMLLEIINICSYHLICLVENFLKNYMIKEHSRRLHIIIIIQKMIMIFC